MDSLLLSFGTVRIEWQTALLSFMSAFVLSSILAFVYDKTFQGLSWSKGLLESMVLGSLISCLLMIAIGDNVARGIGIVGSLAIIRFRTNLRDPRDLVFLFASLGVGVASGVQSFGTAVTGTLIFSMAAVLLRFSGFGLHRRTDGIVRFQIPQNEESSLRVAEIMRRVPRHFLLITMRNVSQGDLVDCTYQIKLRRDSDVTALISELEKVDGIRGLTYMNQQTTVEV
mgnify:CR=1 FL=1